MELGIGFDHVALVDARHPIIARLTAGPLKLVDHAERKSGFLGGLQASAQCLPPLFRQIASLEAIAIVGIGAVDAMLNHLANLASQLLARQGAVPKPKRPDAVFPVRIEELLVKRRHLAGEFRRLRRKHGTIFQRQGCPNRLR